MLVSGESGMGKCQGANAATDSVTELSAGNRSLSGVSERSPIDIFNPEIPKISKSPLSDRVWLSKDRDRLENRLSQPPKMLLEKTNRNGRIEEIDCETLLGNSVCSRYPRSYVMTVLLRAGKARVLGIALSMIAIIAVADRAIGNRASLGLFYMLPMVFAGSVLNPWEVIALALACTFLRGWFDIPLPELEALLRFPFSFGAYAGAGLLAIAISSVRREQELRREAEEQLRVLVESSPAAIITVDDKGIVLATNNAADSLIMPEGGSLKGRSVAPYLPVLIDALQFDFGPEALRTSAQCQGLRENGEVFLAYTWFSSWRAPEGKRLAAIIVDSSEEMRDREEENLREITRANRLAVAAMSHEVRNLSGAISVVSNNLLLRGDAANEDVKAIASLARGLETLAATALTARDPSEPEAVSLRKVLDDLRIIAEPQWREAGGRLQWRLSREIPDVLGEAHGLLQAFLNLAQNSLRAVCNSRTKELVIEVSSQGSNLLVRFRDTGPGVPQPDRLFAPFQPGADGSGLGLYVSRSLVRSFGGDIRYETGAPGSCFMVELQKVPERADD
jgi:PAS domain S-box-containing protein